MSEQCLYKLVSRHEVVEAAYSGMAFCTRGSWASKVMMLATPIGDQLLQCHCTV